MIYKPGEAVDRSRCLWGIDVASYQPRINWPELHESGCSFAIVKAVEGVNAEDKNFRGHVEAYGQYVSWCTDNAQMPMKLGCYAYAHPDADYLDARDEARALASRWQWMRDVVAKAIARERERKPYGTPAFMAVERTILPSVFDLETWPPKIRGAELAAWVGEYVRIVERETGMCIIDYTNLSYKESAGIPGLLGERPLWMADYDRDPAKMALTPSVQKRAYPRIPKGTRAGWWLWQPDAHKVAGVYGNNGQSVLCDVNFFNAETVEELEKFIDLCTNWGT